MTPRLKGLLIIIIIYAAAFGAGMIPFILIDGMLLSTAALTVTATAVIYIFTCIFRDTSIYDPYWSAAPPVMLMAVMVKYGLFGMPAVLMFSATLLWSVRLSANWYITFKGIGREDWRYAMYRKKLSPAVYALLNLIGLQMMPTLVVFAALISGIFVLEYEGPVYRIMPGLIIMAAAVALEFISDRAIHGFLAEEETEGLTCRRSVWKWSRHPNYLGEMAFWTGMYISFAGAFPGRWYQGLGVLAVIVLFLFVSIPMMEKHNMERREDYREYMEATPMLLMHPKRSAERQQL